jgi:two-component system, NtrC family, sensor kinase
MKLTLSTTLIIIVVLSGYGYFKIISNRDILIRKMKLDVMSISRTMRISLERLPLLREQEYFQNLIDAVEEYEQTLGIVVYLQEKDTLLRSHSLEEGIEPYVELIKRSIQEDRPQEEFGIYKKAPVFSYTFPFKDEKGKNIGGVTILHHTSFVGEEIKRTEWRIFITTLVLIGGILVLLLLVTKKWIIQPIYQLLDGIKNLAKGNLNTRIHLKGGDEFSELAKSFNQMAIDLKSAQERIIEETERLRQSEKLGTIGQLASGLAHEIGTPLNIISGRVELTKRRIEDEIAIKNLDIISQQTERITKIIQQLLGFVRKKKPEQKTLNLGTFLETTLDFLDHQIQNQKVTVVKEVGDNIPAVIGEPDQLQQVFLNLFLNAIQAMPEGGTLRLSASSKLISKEGLENERRQYVEVCVEDTGVGMDKEAILNIFNPFFTTKNTGTGLGLMVSQGIIQDHEGWIKVESEIGKGSVFRVYLPSLQGEVRNDG